MRQSDVADELGDRVVHGGNHHLLGVSLDVMDTFLDGLGRSLFVLSYVMLVHPLLDFPLPFHLVLECIVIVSDLHVHTSNGDESTQHLNEDPNGAPTLFPLGLWWCYWYRVLTSKIVWKVSRSTDSGIFAILSWTVRTGQIISYFFFDESPKNLVKTNSCGHDTGGGLCSLDTRLQY